MEYFRKYPTPSIIVTMPITSSHFWPKFTSLSPAPVSCFLFTAGAGRGALFLTEGTGFGTAAGFG